LAKTKKTILILGATGMLGSAVYGVLKDKYRLILTVKDQTKLKLLYKNYGKSKDHQIISFDAQSVYDEYRQRSAFPGHCLNSLLKQTTDVDYVINAIGLVILPSHQSPELAFFINGAFPHILSRQFQKRLIHITTDCVFNGKEDYPYDEVSEKSAVDLYGLSKGMGEPPGCLCLRTSIIGPELGTSSGLLEWFTGQGRQTVQGYANHIWNGITTKKFGQICDEIISNPWRYPTRGLFHIFSQPISKYDLFLKMQQKYKTKCEIKKKIADPINRTLTSLYDLNNILKIQSIDQMLMEL